MAPQKEKLEHLARVPLFMNLSKRELGAILKRSEEIEVPAGTKVVEENKTGGDLYVILDGKAKVTRRNRTLTNVSQGQYFGELAVFGQNLRSATVTAETPMRLLVLGEQDLAKLVKSVPSLALKLLRSMAGQLREANSRAYTA